MPGGAEFGVTNLESADARIGLFLAGAVRCTLSESEPAGPRFLGGALTERRVLLRGAVLTALVLASALVLYLKLRSGPDGPQTTQAPRISLPPAWDEAAFMAFAQAGIAPPRTVFTHEIPAEFDLERAREAIADAKRAELSRFRRESTDSGRGTEAAEEAVEARELEIAEAGEIAALEDFPGPELAVGGQLIGEWANAIQVASQEEWHELQDGPTPPTEAPRVLDARIIEPPRIGKILYRGESGRYESLVPRALRVHVMIEGPRARTLVDYVFSNPHDRRLEGTFYDPLPSGASPAAFGMFRAAERISEDAFARGKLLPPVAAEPGGFATEDSALAHRTAAAVLKSVSIAGGSKLRPEPSSRS